MVNTSGAMSPRDQWRDHYRSMLKKAERGPKENIHMEWSFEWSLFLDHYLIITNHFPYFTPSLSLCENLLVEQEINPVGGSTWFISNLNTNLFGRRCGEEIQLYLVYHPHNAAHRKPTSGPSATQNPAMLTRNHGVFASVPFMKYEWHPWVSEDWN